MENSKCIYRNACQLLKKEDNNTKEVYKSKYAARKLFAELRTILSAKLENDAANCNICQEQLAAVFCHLGTIDVDTEELSTGQNNFEKAIEICDHVKLSPLIIYPAIFSRNSLAILWASRDEQEKAATYLKEAKNLYLKYKEEDLPAPKTQHELFEYTTHESPIGWDALEMSYTTTLYCLAQVLEKLGQEVESAEMCMSTLQRQLLLNDYLPITWATNAANLAQVFESYFKFRIARRLLAVAWGMVQSINKDEFCNNADRKEEYEECIGFVSKQWGYYCASLLQKSDDDLFILETQSDIDNSQVTYLEQINFLDVEYIAYEKEVICTTVKTESDSVDIFKAGMRWLNNSLKYFTLMEHASTHTEIVQQISTLYKLLAKVEPEFHRQSKMHKRRTDLLSDLVVELNPQYYLNVIRQMHFEIAIAYSEMVECKYSIIGGGCCTNEQIKKINTLVGHGLTYFEKLLDSFNSDQNGEKIFSEDYVKTALLSYSNMGKLWSKYYFESKASSANSCSKALEYKKKVISYCQSHPEIVSLVEDVLDHCRQMVELLQIRLARILSDMSTLDT